MWKLHKLSYSKIQEYITKSVQLLSRAVMGSPMAEFFIASWLGVKRVYRVPGYPPVNLRYR